MGDDLALACVLCPVSCIEETALNADESVIKITVASGSVERCVSPSGLVKRRAYDFR